MAPSGEHRSQSPWNKPAYTLSSETDEVLIGGTKSQAAHKSSRHGIVIFQDQYKKQQKQVYPPSKNLLFIKSLHDKAGQREPDAIQEDEPMSEVDAKIAAAEARTDTKFAEMMGELRVITQKLEHVEKSTSGIRLNIWLAAATAVGLVVGIFSWGTSMFGVGMDAQSIADQSAKNVVLQAEPRFSNINASMQRLDKNYETLHQQLGIILTTIEAQQRNEPPVKNIPNQ